MSKLGRNQVIVKVRQSRSSKQKTITVPKDAKHIKSGDYVKLTRLKGK